MSGQCVNKKLAIHFPKISLATSFWLISHYGLEHTNGCNMVCASRHLFYSSPWEKLVNENDVDKEKNRYKKEHGDYSFLLFR
jgi:hypothetical protein